MFQLCLTSVSYTNSFYSCSECAAIEDDEWCQGNVSARLSERFHSWIVESQHKKRLRKKFRRRKRRRKKKFRLINDRLNENLMRHLQKISIHMHSGVNMIRSHDSFQLLNFPREISSAWHYYTFITSDNKLTQLLMLHIWIFIPSEFRLCRFFLPSHQDEEFYINLLSRDWERMEERVMQTN